MKKISPHQLQKKLTEVNILLSQGNISASENLLTELFDSFPNHPDVLSKLGTIYLCQEKLNDGISLIKKSLSINSFQPELLKNYAVALLNIGKPDEALKEINQAIQLNPNYIDAYYHQGIIYKHLRLLDAAIASYRKTIELDPNHLYARINSAVIFIGEKNYFSALNILQETLKINTSSPGIYYNLGLTYFGLKEFNLAIDNLDNAINLNPNYAEAFNIKGLALKNILAYEEAIINFEEAININPNLAEAHNNKGLTLQELKKFDLAASSYSEAMKCNPIYDDAYINNALLMLSNFKFKEGWECFEKREQLQDFLKSKQSITNKYLEELPEKKIRVLLHGEQGIGDHILFFSILHELQKLNYEITVKTDKRLFPILNRSFQGINFISASDVVHPGTFDFESLLGSLPHFFRNSLSDFERQKPAFLYPDQKKSNLLKSKIKNNLICGISWQSKNESVGDFKSVLLNQLLPILNIPNITFVNLQYGDTAKERFSLREKYGVDIINFEEIDTFNDLDGLASLINICDFVVTISNITAHLAGALGKKTYLMLPYSAGKIWYWHEDSDKSIWYPSVSIFRQSKPYAWENVIMNIRNTIEKDYIND